MLLLSRRNFLGAAASGATTLVGQQQQQQQPGFEVKSRLVLVPVNVTDSKGRNVEGLAAEDFMILDNNRSHPATVDSTITAGSPIALSVAVQSSGISSAALAHIRKIGAMIPPLLTGDRGCASLVDFAAHIRWRQECTASADALSRAFASVVTGEPRTGRLLDAVDEAVERLSKRNNMRRVLFLISEARDRGSSAGLGEVLMNAQVAGVTIYAATYSAFQTAMIAKPSDNEPPPIPQPPPWVPRGVPGEPPGRERGGVPPVEQRGDILGGLGELKQAGKVNAAKALANGTGGVVYSFARQKGLEDAIEKLGAELHTQYVLAFTPRSLEPGYHRLDVRLTRAGSYRIRSRPGYWMTGAEQ